MRHCATTYQPRARAGSRVQLHKVDHSGQDISALTRGFYASDCGVDRTSLHTPGQSRSMSSTVLPSQVQSALSFALTDARDFVLRMADLTIGGPGATMPS